MLNETFSMIFKHREFFFSKSRFFFSFQRTFYIDFCPIVRHFNGDPSIDFSFNCLKKVRTNKSQCVETLWGMRYCFSQQGVIVWEHKGDNGMALLVVFQLGLTIVREFIWILSKVSSSNNTAETTDSITDDLIKNTDNMFFGSFFVTENMQSSF